MMKVQLIRKDRTIQVCTISNGGIKYETNKVLFQPTCKRRADDYAIEIKMLCVN